MANIGGSSGDVVIKIRLDTSQADASLAGLKSRIGDTAHVVGRVGYNGAPSGGGGGYGGGLNIAGMIGGAAGLGALGAFGGADIARGLGSVVAGLGSTYSESQGFASFRRRAASVGEATRMTQEQLGIAGNVVSGQQANALRDFNLSMLQAQDAANSRVAKLTGAKAAKDYEEVMIEAAELFIKHWPAVAGALIGGRFGKVGGLVGAAVGEAFTFVSGVM